MLDAAIELLGTEGLRALTHARVDERAGVPRGSTSNYFRTRAALLGGAVEALGEHDRTQVEFVLTSPAQLVELLVGLFEHLTVAARVQTTARLVLFMEASHDADLRAAVSRGRAAMDAMLVPALAQLGARDPVTAAAAIAACSEGLILHRIARHDDSDPRPVLELVVNAAVR